MVEALVTAAAEVILEKAFSLAANEFAIAWGFKENALVKEWMKQLRDVVSEADDLLDEVQYEVLRHEVKKR
nr:hypothetical protein [Tanacetum cinerariifolium]